MISMIHVNKFIWTKFGSNYQQETNIILILVKCNSLNNPCESYAIEMHFVFLLVVKVQDSKHI